MAVNSYENLANWYFRLNGCLTIPNFVLHAEIGSDQCTDADVLAVRFPYRKEIAGRPLEDDKVIAVQRDLIQLFIVEVKKGKCALNKPYSQKTILDRLVQSTGIAPAALTGEIANSLCNTGAFTDKRLLVRIVCIGNRKAADPRALPRDVMQLTHTEMLLFIHRRFHGSEKAKRAHGQWDQFGKDLYNEAEKHLTPEDFSKAFLKTMTT